MKSLMHAIALGAMAIAGLTAQSLENTLQAGLPARWWRQPELAQKLGLSADQQGRMDDTFIQHRLKLVDLNAALQKEETLLDPLVSVDRPEEARVRAQIDRIAQARAELEKGKAYLLLSLRLILTPEQWRTLRAETPRPRRPGSGANRDGAQPVPRKSR